MRKRIFLYALVAMLVCLLAFSACNPKAVEHVCAYGDWEQTVDPTCEKAGEETRTCIVYASHKDVRPVAILGHNWGEWINTATCENAGEEMRICSYDALHKQINSCAALGHDWGEWIIKDATVAAMGEKTKKCSHDETHTVKLPIPIKTTVGAGSAYTLVVDEYGNLWSMGLNDCGQLGDGSNVDSYSPVRVKEGTEFSAVSGGFKHSLAIDVNGYLWAWGFNTWGRLGDGTINDSCVPVRIKEETKFSAVSAGDDHSLAIDEDGNLWTWGNNSMGQLGDGNPSDAVYSPINIKEGTKFCAISAGNGFSYAIDAEGNLWGWGSNYSGELGDGTTGNDKRTPVLVKRGTKFSTVSAGTTHSFAIDLEGNLWAWGDNQYGKLGDGTTTNRYLPIKIKENTKFSSVSAGTNHSIAIDNDGNLFAWGNCALFVDDVSERYSPIQIDLDIKFISVSAGLVHGIVTDVDGNPWAWGWNYYGQLGDGTNTNKSMPSKMQLFISSENI